MNELRFLIGFLVAAWGTMLFPAMASAQDYLLGPEDIVSVRVAIWDDATSNYVPMQAISGDYEVSVAGTISMPVVGSIAAEGATIEDVGTLVAESLRESAGLLQLPVVSLQILEYRPFYVSGDVTNPGAYTWRPQLTAVKALALSGGLLRAREGQIDEASGFREVNQLQSVQVELVRLRAREARLIAELADTETIEFPEQIYHPDGPEVVERIKAEERSILTTRLESKKRAIQSNEALIELYRTELSSLQSKLEGQKRQIEITREQVENLTKLVERGTVPANRLITMERTLMDQNADELDMNTAIFRARQRIGETQRDLLQLTDNRRQQIVAELQDARHNIVLQTKREEMFSGLAAMSGIRPVNTPYVVKMNVRRLVGGETVVRSIGPDDLILPGDVFQVELAFELSGQ